MSPFLWILFGVLYLTALFVLGFATLRKGHTALFWFGILFPFLWIIGALMQPTPAEQALRPEQISGSAASSRASRSPATLGAIETRRS